MTAPTFAPGLHAKPTRTLMREFLQALSSDEAANAGGVAQLRKVLADKLGEPDLAVTLNLTLFEALGNVTLGELMALIEGP